mgnify:CR=1 FL=1
MNYEKIIVELLGRIQVLEEQVAMLMQEKNQTSEQEANKITTDDIRQHILELKTTAKDSGKKFIILKSGDIHKALKLKSAMPQVCNAMRQSMNEGDIVLYFPVESCICEKFLSPLCIISHARAIFNSLK